VNQKFVLVTTPSPLLSLPFPDEDLLWRCAIESNSFSMQFAHLLCCFYAANDGYELTDQNMIHTFLTRWKMLDRNEPSVIKLLQIFVDTVEWTDNLLHPGCHFPVAIERFQRNTEIQIFHGQECYKLTVARSIEIGGLLLALIEQENCFFEINPSSLAFFASGKRKKITSRLSKLLDQGITDFTVCVQGLSPLHARTSFPSTEIACDSELVKSLMSAFDGSFTNLVYSILILLPRAIFCTPFPLSFDSIFASLFSVRLSFFDLFAEESSENSVERFQEIFEFASRFEINSPFIEDVITICCEIICVLSQKSLGGLLEQTVFRLLLKWMEIPSFLNTISRGFSFFFRRTHNYRLPLPEENYDVLLGLSSADPNIRSFTRDVLERVDIPIGVFQIFLTKNPTDDFLDCLSSHITPQSSEEEITSICNSIVKHMASAHSTHLSLCISVLHEAVTNNLLNKMFQDAVTKSLIEGFLTTSISPIDLVALPAAAQFLVQQSLTEDCLSNALASLHFDRVPFEEGGIDSTDLYRPSIGAIGLQNLGNTCYLNAVLQQLFAIEPFCNAILGIDAITPFERELSQLFWLMKESNSRYVSPDRLVSQYMLSGEPLNPHEQRDAVELLQDLLTRFEANELICALFTGTVKQTVVGDNGFEKSIIESFRTIELEVRGYLNLIDAFNRFNNSIHLTDYHFENGSIGRAQKRTTIEHAPPILILQLKRFTFDVQQQVRTKVDDIFEISDRLDISLYSGQIVPEYKLRGVIIHNGSAQAGHYFSFIRRSSQWLCFDDRRVSLSSETEVFKISQGQMADRGSAYVLLYERPHDIHVPVTEDEPFELAKHKEMMNIKRFFCGEEYFDLMSLLLNQPTMTYHDFVMKYIVDSLMFSNLSD
jgi:hypothetical protein